MYENFYQKPKIGNTNFWFEKELDTKKGIKEQTTLSERNQMWNSFNNNAGKSLNVSQFKVKEWNVSCWAPYSNRYCDKTRKYDVTDYIINKFDIAKKYTQGNPYNFVKETWENWDIYDIKRDPIVLSIANKNNWKVYFDWIEVEPSNIGNLLAWFNTKNSSIPKTIVRWWFLATETLNAIKDWYGTNSFKIANIDEYSDDAWYNEWEKLYNQYFWDKQNKINQIRKSIEAGNKIYYWWRAQEEQKLKNLYKKN